MVNLQLLTIIKVGLIQVLLLDRDSSRNTGSRLFCGGTSLGLYWDRRWPVFGHSLEEGLLLDDSGVILRVLGCLGWYWWTVCPCSLGTMLVIALTINDVLMFWGWWRRGISSSEQVVVGGWELDNWGMLVGGMLATQVRGLGWGTRVDQNWTMGVWHHSGSRLRVNRTAWHAFSRTGVQYGLALLLKSVVRRGDTQAGLLTGDEARHQATVWVDDPPRVIVWLGRHPQHLRHGITHPTRFIFIHRLGLNRRNWGSKMREYLWWSIQSAHIMEKINNTQYTICKLNLTET